MENALTIENGKGKNFEIPYGKSIKVTWVVGEKSLELTGTFSGLSRMADEIQLFTPDKLTKLVPTATIIDVTVL